LVISALLALTGVIWFFLGLIRCCPGSSRANECRWKSLRKPTPVVEQHIFRNEGQKAIWFAGFGLTALIAALKGFRQGTRWPWNATWILVGVPFAIGINYLPGGEISFDNFGFFLFGGAALVSQLIARKG